MYGQESFVMSMESGSGKDNSNWGGCKRLPWSLRDKMHEKAIDLACLSNARGDG